MKFRVTRTSRKGEICMGSKIPCKPCEEAKLVKATLLEYERADWLQKAKAKNSFWAKKWYKDHCNLKIENGIVIGEKKTKDKVWIIEIKSLSDILNLYKKYGDLIILESVYKEYPIEIEIYDDYRESDCQ